MQGTTAARQKWKKKRRSPLCTSCMVNLFHLLYSNPPTFTGAAEPLVEEQVQLLHLQHFSSFSSPPLCLPPSPKQHSIMHFRCRTDDDTSDHFEWRLHRWWHLGNSSMSAFWLDPSAICGLISSPFFFFFLVCHETTLYACHLKSSSRHFQRLYCMVRWSGTESRWSANPNWHWWPFLVNQQPQRLNFFKLILSAFFHLSSVIPGLSATTSRLSCYVFCICLLT